MDKEKMNGRELTEKEMEQVSGGNAAVHECSNRFNEIPCISPKKGTMLQCATCPKNN